MSFIVRELGELFKSSFLVKGIEAGWYVDKLMLSSAHWISIVLCYHAQTTLCTYANLRQYAAQQRLDKSSKPHPLAARKLPK
jgi:hypothetical protein